MADDKLRRLYDTMSSVYTMDEPYEEFQNAFMSKPDVRRKVYDAMSAKFTMDEPYEEFEQLLTSGATNIEQAKVDAAPEQKEGGNPAVMPQAQAEQTPVDTAAQVMANSNGYTPRSIVPQTKAEWDTINQKASEIKQQEEAKVADPLIQQAEQAQKESKRNKFVSLLRAMGPEFAETAGPRPVTLEDAQEFEQNAENYRLNKLTSETLDEALDTMHAAEEGGGIGQGMIDMGTRVSTWDLGYSDVIKGLTLNNLVEKYESGQPLSEAEDRALDMVALSTYIMNEYQNGLGIGYKVGESLPQSLGFMASLALNPASGLGEAMMKKAISKYGKQGLKQLTKRQLADVVGKRVLYDALEMGTATVTSGGLRTLGDALERVNGSATYELSPEGFITYGGQYDQDQLGHAAVKAFENNFIENWTEAMGEYIKPTNDALKDVLGRLTDKTLRRKNWNRMADWINSIPESQWAKQVEKFKKATKFNGIVGEIVEEEVGMFLEPLIVKDNTLGENFAVWSDDPVIREKARENQLVTVLSCSLMSGTLYGVEAMGAKGKIDKTLNESDLTGRNAFGRERWEAVKEVISQSSEDDMVRNLKDIVYDPELNADQRVAVVNYVSKLIQSQQFNTTSEKAKQELDEISKNLTAAFDAGYRMGIQAEPRSMRSVNLALQQATVNVESMNLGEIAHQLEEADAVTRNQTLQGLGAQEREAIEYYLGCLKRQQGLYEGVEFDAGAQIDEAVYDMAPAVQTDADGKHIVTSAVTADGRSVYVLGGEGAMSIVIDEEGNKTPYPADQLSDVVVSDADALESQLRQAIRDEWMGRLSFYSAHNEKTQQPQIGLAVGDGDETVVITDMGQNWVTVQQAKVDDMGNVEANPNGTSRDVTIDYILALQDEIYDRRDAMDGNMPVDEAAQAQTEDMTAVVQQRAEQWAAVTGQRVRLIGSVEEVDNAQAQQAIMEGRNVTGWFNDATGEVCFYVPNITDLSEVDRTYIHEVVGHKGMRMLLGERGYATLCDRVWNDLMTYEDKANYLDKVEHVQGDKKIAAADEYIAYFAEQMNLSPDEVSQSIWQKIVQIVKDILSSLGLGEEITTDELGQLLQASLARFQEQNRIEQEQIAQAEAQKQAEEASALNKIPVITDAKTGETIDYEWSKAPDVDTALQAMREAGIDEDVIKGYAADMIKKLSGDIKKLEKPKATASLTTRQSNKAKIQDIDNQIKFWQDIAQAFEAEKQAEQESIDAFGSDYDSVWNAVNNIIDEMDFETQVRFAAAKQQYIWADSPSGTKGFASHMIAARGDKRGERMANIGWLVNRDKGGKYPEEIAEAIYGNLPDALKEGHDTMEVLDIIIETIREANHPATVVRQIYKDIIQSQEEAEQRRLEQEAEEEERYKDAWARDRGFDNFQNYLTFEELQKTGEDIIEIPQDELENYYNTLYGSDADGELESGVQAVVQSAAGQEGTDSEGNTLGQGEEAAQQGVGIRTGGSEESSDNVLPGTEGQQVELYQKTMPELWAMVREVLEDFNQKLVVNSLTKEECIRLITLAAAESEAEQAIIDKGSEAASEDHDLATQRAKDLFDYFAEIKARQTEAKAQVVIDTLEGEEQKEDEYVKAVNSGNIDEAIRLLREKALATPGITAYSAANPYAGQHRDIAKLIKTSASDAVKRAAVDMAKFVPDNAVLIPVPPHTGKVEDDSDTMILANAISDITGSPVVVALEGDERKSRYQAKQEGEEGPKAEELGFRKVADIPEGKIPVFVDNVVDSGETAKAAKDAIGGGLMLAYAKGVRSKAVKGLKNMAITYDDNGNLIPLSQRFDAENEDIRYREINDQASLMGSHNITPENLKNILKRGGLANPSMAVVNTDNHIHTNYGDISLIPYASRLDASKYPGVVTYSGDAYTPEYPTIIHQLTAKGEKKLDDMVKSLGKGDRQLENFINSNLYNYADDNGTHLTYEYAATHGLNPEIAYEQPRYSKEEYDRLYAIVGDKSSSSLTKEEKQQVLDILMSEKQQEVDAKIKNAEDKGVGENKPWRTNYLNMLKGEVEDYRKRITDENGEIYFATLDSYIYDVYKAERLRREPRLDSYRTQDNALQQISEAGLNDDYWKWVGGLLNDEEWPEMLFAGRDYEGRRKLVPNTLENASRLMNKAGDANAVDWNGYNATKSLMLKKMRTLSDIRKYKNMLIPEEDYHQQAEKMSKEWAALVGELADMQKIDDNPYINHNYAENRIQEAITMKNPIAYLNKEYRYNIDKDSEFAKELMDAIFAMESAPAKYFETKFKRPVYLGEFKTAIIPDDLDDDLRRGLQDAGINLVEYKHGDLDDRIEKTRRATEGDSDVRFREANTKTDIFISNAQRAVENIKQEKATPDQWLAMIQKAGGLKAGEDKWLGLSEWLKDKKSEGVKTLTKAEINAFIEENKIEILEERYSQEAVADYNRALKEYEDEYAAFIEEAEKNGEDDPHEWAFNQMIERYGDDFDLAFMQDGNTISPTENWDMSGYTGYAMYFLEQRLRNNERVINETRLKFTTDALENKREIALWIPDIESWKEFDNVHFGDAGDGRTIGWIRFGNVEKPNIGGDAYERFETYRLRKEAIERQIRESQRALDRGVIGKRREAEEVLLKNNKELLAELNEQFADVANLPVGRYLAIDEIQSNRHQEGRKRGYKPYISRKVRQEYDELKKQYMDAAHEFTSFVNMLNAKYGSEAKYIHPEDLFEVDNKAFGRWFAKLTDEEREKYNRLDSERTRTSVPYNEMEERLGGGDYSDKVPDAPFDKNWAELCMKRMLRLAAEENYDKLAWTSGDIQKERYDLGQYISVINSTGWKDLSDIFDDEDSDTKRFTDVKEITASGDDVLDLDLVVNRDGLILTDVNDRFTGHYLSEVVGEEVANHLLQDEAQAWTGARLRLGENGMNVFYDEMLPAFMEKYGKQWGVKAELQEIPGLDGQWWTIDINDAMKESVMQGQVMFRIGDNEQTEKLNDKQKQPGEIHPEVEDIVADDIRFRLSKNNRKSVEAWLKKRTDIDDAERASVLLYIGNLESPKIQLATGWWFAKGTVRLPEDQLKIDQAVKVSEIAKVDPLKYSSPMELINDHLDIELKGERINPDEVSTLHKVKELPEGIVIYDVDEGNESRQNMREIINTHFGKESSPWCLLQGDEDGNLTEQSGEYWNHYSAYPKQVAFKDGKLLAFSASSDEERLWWDRKDESSLGIPIEGKIKGDPLGRSGKLVMNPETGKTSISGFLYRGNKENGVYEEWHDNNQLRTRIYYKNGVADGPILHWYPNGQKSLEFNRSNGREEGPYMSWYSNGQVHRKAMYRDGYLEGVEEYWYENGKPLKRNVYHDNILAIPYNQRLKRVAPYESWFVDGTKHEYIPFDKFGQYNGKATTWYENGNIAKEIVYKDDAELSEKTYWQNGNLNTIDEWNEQGKRNGVKERYDKDGKPTYKARFTNGQEDYVCSYYHAGQPSLIQNFKNGVRAGVEECYWPNGELEYTRHYDDQGRRQGVEKHFYASGELHFLRHWKNNEANGVWETYGKDGHLEDRTHYKNGQLHGTKEFFGRNGEVIVRETFENGERVKDEDLWQQRTLFREKRINDAMNVLFGDDSQGSLFTPEEMQGKGKTETAKAEPERKAVDKEEKAGPNPEDIIKPLRKLEPGETCLVQRKMTEDKNFNFTVGNKIETYEDIAYIFKELEDSSIENCFMVFYGGECKEAIVLHLSMGGLSSASVDMRQILPVIQNVNPSNVCLVHNHPSGNLERSRQDDHLLMSINQLVSTFAPGVIVDPGIIIDTTSGEFGVFGEGFLSKSEKHQMPEKVEGEHGLKVYNFDRSVFAADYKPGGLGKIRTSRDIYDIAAFISGQRLGKRDKINILCLDQSGGVIGNFFSELTAMESAEDGKLLAGEAARYAGACGATAIVIYGTGVPSHIGSTKGQDAAMLELRALLSRTEITPLDALRIDEGAMGYYSYADHGVWEPEQQYGGTRFREYTDRQEGETPKDFVKRTRDSYRKEFNEVAPIVILGEEKLSKPELKVKLGVPHYTNINKVYEVYESAFGDDGKINNVLGWSLNTLGINKSVIFARESLEKERTVMTTMIHESVHAVVSEWAPDDMSKAAAAIFKWGDDEFGHSAEDNYIRRLYRRLQNNPESNEDNELIAHILGYDIEQGIDRERVKEYAAKMEGTEALFDEILNKIHKTNGYTEGNGGGNQPSGRSGEETPGEGGGEVETPKNTTLDQVLFRIGVNHNSPYLLKKADGAFYDEETGERLGFDYRFIGSGQGSQTHGWGAYFSVQDLREYAYADANYQGYTYKGQEIGLLEGANPGTEDAVAVEVMHAMSWDDKTAEEAIASELDLAKGLIKVLKFQQEEASENEKSSFDYYIERHRKDIKILKSLNPDDFVRGEGRHHHYDVSIPDNTGDNYLEEMKTLPKSQRRRIAEAVRGLKGEPAQSFKYVNYRNGWESLANMIERNQWAYLEIRDRLIEAFGLEFGRERRLSKMMHSIGFVGVHYDGQYDGECYVIFDPEDAVITDHTLFREGRISPEIDAKYKKAYEEGDTEKAQRMVRSAFLAKYPNTEVKNTVYHGTWEEPFNVFKTSEWTSEKSGLSRIKGYFSSDKSYAENYGPVKSFYLNITKMLNIPFYDKTLTDWKKWFEKQGVEGVEFDSSIEEESLKGADYGDGIKKYYPVELFDTSMGFNGDGNLTEMIEKAGYNGIHYPGDESAYMPFKESQIKSAEPFTFDDNGNLIPLSQRFNSESDDIRYREVTPKNTTLDQVLFRIGVNHNSPYLLKKADGAFYDEKTGERLGFDTRFMSRGEGGQAHGWGSYFSVDDLFNYAFNRNETKIDVLYNGKSVRDNLPSLDPAYFFIKGKYVGRDGAIKKLKSALNSGMINDNRKNVYEAALNFLEGTKEGEFENATNRHHYDVTIPDNTGDNYLDEQARMKEQSAILDKVYNALADEGWSKEDSGDERMILTDVMRRVVLSPSQTGGDFYAEVSWAKGGPEAASKYLNGLGVTGIHYNGQIDGECYVIFNPEDAVITNHTMFRELKKAEAQTDTNPTEAQKEAGNYKKGHIRLFGMDLSIENPEGSVRRGTDASGKEWEQEMNNTYGYIRGTMGRDKDHIDFFLGDNLDSDKVYIVDQRDTKSGKFDEHKIMLGFDDMEEARDAYNSNYEEGWQGLGAISELSLDDFKEWAFADGRRVQPYSDVRFREREEKEYERIENELGVAAVRYERAMDDSSKRLVEVMQDSMKSVDELQKALSEADGKPIRDYENAYWAAIQYSSRNKAMQDNYQRYFFRPLLEEVASLVKGEDDQEAALNDLTTYLMAKHGLERNEVFARRDAKKEFEEYKKQNPNTTVTEDYFYNKKRQRDYSGLIALTDRTDEYNEIIKRKKDTLDMLEERHNAGILNDDDYEKAVRRVRKSTRSEIGKLVQEAEADARIIVDSYEYNHDTANLWKRINAATKETLRTSYNGGVLSEEKYKELATMFQNYIPLRGFEETTSDEVYGYYGTVNSPYNTAIKSARGRHSLADSPIATIGNIADSEIMRANRNRIYMAALALAEGHKSPLMAVSEVMFKRNPQTGEWEIAMPQLDANDSPEEVARKMTAYRNWFAQQLLADPDNFRTQKEMANVPYRVINKSALSEHQILVTRGGKKYIITINGNPRAAQALTGRTNADSNLMLPQVVSGLSRWISRTRTQWNVGFVMRNLCRDAIFANINVRVTESPSYAAKYNKNWGKVAINMASLLHKYNAGTLDDGVTLERYFKEFIDNGGETGYTKLLSVKDYKKEMAKEIKKLTQTQSAPKAVGEKVLEIVGGAVENMNRWAEGITRFAAYLTSREQGRSETRSVEDAKEISVNFNKKGAGTAALTEKDKEDKKVAVAAAATQIGREGYSFFNANIQGLAKFIGAIYNNPKAGTALLSGLVLAGVMMAAINGGDGDDDDEKEYYNLPEYIRRSCLCIKVGKHWLTLPLPPEYTALYGLGELLHSAMSGNEYYEPDELAYEIASQFSQLLPLDLLEGRGSGAWQNFIPTGLRTIVENETNLNWMGQPIYNESVFNENDPEWRKAFRGASPALVGMARKLSDWTGGNVGKPGKININPAKWEHFFEGYFGGIFSEPSKVVKAIRAAAGDEEMQDVRNYPIISGFMRDTSNIAEIKAENSRWHKVDDFVEKLLNEDRRLRQMVAEKTITGYDYDEKNVKEAEQRLEELRSSEDWDFAQQWQALGKARDKARQGNAEEEFNKLTKQMNEMYKEFRKRQRNK